MFIKNRVSLAVYFAMMLTLILGVLNPVRMVEASPITHSDISGFGETSSLTSMDDPRTNSSLSTIQIPTLDDWQTGHVAFTRGTKGEWDYYLWGGFANSLIKKDNVYYLYYQGSPSYDDQCESVSYRGIGLATSTDGINWIKSENNPVISWSDQGSVEEGAASAAVWVGNDGKFYVYYGANSGSGCTVNSSARLAVSEDGINFQDFGEVLSGNDPNVWGSGDEIFPVGAYSFADHWYLYYVPNGVQYDEKLGIAIGDNFDNFTQSMGVNNATIPSWGPVSIIVGDPDAVLITNPNGVNGPINIYKFDVRNPSFVDLHDSYALPNCTQVSVIYDNVEGLWAMSCRDSGANNYLIKYARPDAGTATPTITPTLITTSTLTSISTSTVTPTPSNTFMPTATFTSTSTPTSTPTFTATHTPTFTVTSTPTSTPTATFTATNTSTFTPTEPTFGDVPVSHPYYNAIQILYANGYTAGCSTLPLNFCPNASVSRAQSAVFMLRGNFGGGYVPVTPSHFFKDNWKNSSWGEGWAESMFLERLTAGCSVLPLKFCPDDILTNVQMAVFGLRLKHGMTYEPPAATGLVFADLTDTGFWSTSWAEAAYAEGLLPACGLSNGKPLFCPNNLVTRGFGASVIIKAKDLSMP